MNGQRKRLTDHGPSSRERLRAAIMAAAPQGALPSEASGSGSAPQATTAATNSLNAPERADKLTRHARHACCGCGVQGAAVGCAAGMTDGPTGSGAVARHAAQQPPRPCRARTYRSLRRGDGCHRLGGGRGPGCTIRERNAAWRAPPTSFHAWRRDRQRCAEAVAAPGAGQRRRREEAGGKGRMTPTRQPWQPQRHPRPSPAS